MALHHHQYCPRATLTLTVQILRQNQILKMFASRNCRVVATRTRSVFTTIVRTTVGAGASWRAAARRPRSRLRLSAGSHKPASAERAPGRAAAPPPLLLRAQCLKFLAYRPTLLNAPKCLSKLVRSR